MKSLSLGNKLEEHQGFGPGFDFCRVMLALSVVAGHSCEVVLGDLLVLNKPVIWIINYSILPMFFALSGFLIAGSAQRLSLGNFLINRSLRILPALSVEIILSAFILGPLLSALAPHEYFKSSNLYSYMLNIFGIVHYTLPGVFSANPIPLIVNASLWTVPLEISCYALISIAILLSIVNHNWWLVTIAVLYVLLGNLCEALPYNNSAFIHFFDFVFSKRGYRLIPCFLMGIAIFNLRYQIPYSRAAFIIFLVLTLISGLEFSFGSSHNAILIFFFTPVFSYMIIFAGLSRMPKLLFYSTGDYSYGIYLYAYPIQQALIKLFPALSIVSHMIFSIIIATLFATFSWHCIEKPILRMRKNFAFVARKHENQKGN